MNESRAPAVVDNREPDAAGEREPDAAGRRPRTPRAARLGVFVRSAQAEPLAGGGGGGARLFRWEGKDRAAVQRLLLASIRR